MNNFFWLSFCDVTKPKGSQFLGACIVSANDIESAVQKSWILGINPGGEVACVELDLNISDIDMILNNQNKLMSKTEINELGFA
jgi:hypothetical protein